MREKFEKKSHNAEKTERGPFWIFQTSILLQNSEKNEGGTVWGKKISRKKSHNAEKAETGTLWFRAVLYVTR